MVGAKPFIFFLTDTSTGLCWYVDNKGNVKKANVHSGVDVSLPNAPANWMELSLGFKRNMVGNGIMRSYAEPINFVKDASKICRKLFYTGTGVENQLTLVVYKRNDSPKAGEANYKLYTKGQLDLAKFGDDPNMGFQVNLMEGGISQLLAVYGSTTFEIPCDGSIAENKKARLDGMLLPDVLTYDIGYCQPGRNERSFTIPCTFVANDGDSFGIIHQDPSYGIFGIPWSTNANFIFSSQRAITVRIKGSLVARPYSGDHPDYFDLYVKTSKNDINDLALPTDPILINTTYVNNFGVYQFDRTVTLAANESLFICSAHSSGAAESNQGFAIESGSLQISYNSMAQTTTPWCITAYDMGRLLVQEMNKAASTTTQKFDFGFDSTLLLNNLNLFYTGGDPIRASGDANYPKYYQQFSVGNTTELITAFGPVIKISWADFFDDVSKRLCASYGSQQLPGAKESVYIETMGYAYNANANQMDVGEISNLKLSLDTELSFSRIKIGTAKQSYDQKAGKYETNTVNEFLAPIKSMQKTLDLTKKFRDDAYGIELLRSGLGGTSTSRNSSDNDVFVINVDPDSKALDYQKSTFVSQVPDQNDPNNTNIRLKANLGMQGITMTTLQGSYLSMNNDPSIFVFSHPAFSQTLPLSFVVTGFLLGNVANNVSGNPTDSVTIKLFMNGSVIQTFKFDATTTKTDFAINYSTSLLFREKDNLYATATTSITGSATLDICTLSIGANASYWQAQGVAIDVDTGTPIKMLAMPQVVAPAGDGGIPNGGGIVSFGFQYFMFNSILTNSDFDIAANITVTQRAGSNDACTFYLYKNGLYAQNALVGNQPAPRTVLLNGNNETLKIGDVFFILVSPGNMDTDVRAADITFTSRIETYGLKRVQYDSISGIPSLATDPITGLPSTTAAGAPYNIEDMTPKRQLLKWGPYLRSSLFNQTGRLRFVTSAKNQYLSTTYQGVTITENADIAIGDLGDPLFYNLIADFDMKVPLNYNELLTAVANSHINAVYNGVNIGGFPMEVKQKIALNDMQSCQIRLSTRTNLADLQNLNLDGINLSLMPPNSMMVSKLCPLQFVPLGLILGPRYHHPDMDNYWLVDQAATWANSNNYWQPWQNNDPIPLQLITNGLNPLTLQVYRVDRHGYDNVVNLVQTINIGNPSVSNAISNPYFVWEDVLDISGYDEGTYYTVATAGTGANAVQMISEGMYVKQDWPDTMLFEYSHDRNAYDAFFDTGFTGCLRVHGMIGPLLPEYKGSFYTDQPQDISIISAFPYDTFPLFLGRQDGIPDWMIKKISLIMLLDNVFIENRQYSLDDNAKFEPTFFNGNPKQYWKTTIRPSETTTFVGIGLNGVAVNSSIVSIDASGLGPNINNSALTTTSDIITIEIKN